MDLSLSPFLCLRKIEEISMFLSSLVGISFHLDLTRFIEIPESRSTGRLSLEKNLKVLRGRTYQPTLSARVPKST